MFELIILSLIQGITEFLPISSTSHLILISKLSDFQNQNLSIDISLHIGSFLAVTFYFFKDIINFIKNKLLFFKILLASIPIIIIGFILIKFNFIDSLRSIKVIGWMTLLFAIVLYISDRFEFKNKLSNNLDLKSVFFIGSMQVLALIPGVSRSGVTISAARFMKFNRYDSAKISFLLSIPTLGAVSFFGLFNIYNNNDLGLSITNLYAILFSFISSLITIRFFLNYIQKFSLNIFVFYRIILSTIILTIAYL